MQFMTSLENCPCFCRSKGLPHCRLFSRACFLGCYLYGILHHSFSQKRKEKSVVQFGNPSVGTGAKIIWLVPILGNPPNTQKGRQPLREAAFQPQPVLSSPAVHWSYSDTKHRDASLSSVCISAYLFVLCSTFCTRQGKTIRYQWK